MLGFLTKTDTTEVERLNKQVNDLERRLQERDNKISLLESKVENYYIEKMKLEDKIKSLEWKLQEEKENYHKLENSANDKIYFDLLELFGFENENLINSLSAIQNGIATSTLKAKESLKHSSDVDASYTKAFNDISKIVENINSLLKRSHKVAKVIDELSKKAVDIEKFIAQINEVVMQINILSLNASVEAASAGDAGKGFAVVASEVKNLANKTSAVASDIERVVKEIQGSIKNTNAEFKDIDSNITSIYKRTSTYDKQIKSLHTLTKTSLKELHNLSDSVFMNLAKIDHVVWKVNTYSSIYAKKPTFEFVNHKNCRLGKWYNEGDGMKYFAKAPSYYKLEKPHEGIHNTTHKVFNLLRSDDKDMNYKRIKDTLGYMEDSSKEVFKVLDDILKETILD